jgi:putative phage-type endonuclease
VTARTLRRVTPTAYRLLPADAARGLWLRERRNGIGSSDVAAIVGVSDFGTAVHVWHDKLGDVRDEEAGEAALWGTLLEDTIAQEWCRRNASVVRRVGLIARVDEPWMRATLDRQVRECPDAADGIRETCALEIKCRSAFKADKWKRKNVPDDVLAQVAWQMAVTGYGHIHVGVLIGGNDYRQATVRRDQVLEAYLVQHADRMWHVNVADRIEPEWDLTHASQLIRLDERLHPERAGVAELDVNGIGEVMEYARLSAENGQATRALKSGAATLRRLADGKAAVKFGDELAYELAPRSRQNVDLEVLAERYPEAYADPAVVSTTEFHQIAIAKTYKQGASK